MVTITERVLRVARLSCELETAALVLAGVLVVARLQSDEARTMAEAILRVTGATAELRRLLPPVTVNQPCVGCGRERDDVQVGRRSVTADALCGPCYAEVLTTARAQWEAATR